jgi:hypothetical protein
MKACFLFNVVWGLIALIALAYLHIAGFVSGNRYSQLDRAGCVNQLALEKLLNGRVYNVNDRNEIAGWIYKPVRDSAMIGGGTALLGALVNLIILGFFICREMQKGSGR